MDGSDVGGAAGRPSRGATAARLAQPQGPLSVLSLPDLTLIDSKVNSVVIEHQFGRQTKTNGKAPAKDVTLREGSGALFVYPLYSQNKHTHTYCAPAIYAPGLMERADLFLGPLNLRQVLLGVFDIYSCRERNTYTRDVYHMCIYTHEFKSYFWIR